MGQTWDGVNSTCTGTASTYTFDQANALTGTVTFAGQSDWRVPNIRELQTIVNRDAFDPSIDRSAFPATSSSFFWSSTNLSYDLSSAWFVFFYDGYAFGGNRIDYHEVRLVRGGKTVGSLLAISPLASDYVDHGDGTVTHTPTHLMWKKCAEGLSWTGGACSGVAIDASADTAAAYTGTFSGRNDWRIPTEAELLSLVDYSVNYPAINSSFFPGTSSHSFWSGSSHANSGSFQDWSVNFGDGSAKPANRYSGGSLRLVRDTQFDGSPSIGGAEQIIGLIGFSSNTLAVGSVTTVTASGGASGNLVTFGSTTPTICAVSGDTVTGLAFGTCTISANQAGNANYVAAAEVTQTIAVAKLSQSISIGTAPIVTVGGSGTLSAIASSGLPVAFAVTTPTVCSVSDTTVTGLTTGTCTLTAIQTGDASFAAAPQVTYNIAIGKVGAPLLQGWNLLGNATDQTVTVGALFSDTAQITTVWKWDATKSSWLFFSPSLNAVDFTTVRSKVEQNQLVRGGCWLVLQVIGLQGA